MNKTAANPEALLPAGLVECLSGLPPLAIAFSGGLDSRFLCHAACLLGHDIILFHVAGPHVSPEESAFARDWAEARNLDYRELGINPLAIPEVAANGERRCYFCKKNIFSLIRKAMSGPGEKRRVLCDGCNRDDLAFYRPGQAAAREAGVISPLDSLTKKDIRAFASATGLDWPEQAARPCLLTRFAYGVRPDLSTLARLAAAEKELADFLMKRECHVDFRLRLVPQPEIHIGAGVEEIHASLWAIAAQHGFDANIRTLANMSGYFDRAH